MTRTSTRSVSLPPTRSKACSSSDAQHLGLGLQAHVADLVEEERAAVGQLELARAAGPPRR